MRILLWSTAPWCRTGYGTGCRGLARTLKALGYDVYIFAYAGCAYGDTIWEGIPVIGNPVGRGHHYITHAQRITKADAVIAWFDLWTIADLIPNLGLRNLIAYTPVDCLPIHTFQAEALKACAVVVPYCRWAHKALSEAKIPHLWEPIYHGVDTTLFAPQQKDKARAYFGIDYRGPLFLTVAANLGERKNLPGHLRAYAEVRDKARYFLWTYPHMDALNAVAFDLEHYWATLAGGVDGYLYIPDPWRYMQGLTEEEMPLLYSTADWLLNVTYSEGFGFPIAEAMACGVPSIVHAWSAMPELVEDGRGLTVSSDGYYPYQALSAWTAIPSHKDFVHKLHIALDMPAEERERMGQAGREWAVAHLDWREVGRQWQRLLRSL